MKKRILACFMAVCMLVCLSVTASAADETYTDLNGYDWAEEAIYRWTEAGIVEGNGDNTFNPAGLLKRSEAAKIFANLLKLVEKSDKVFVDVPGTEWYADYVALVNKAGIMNGMSETTFEPATPVSREMVFTMVCRALGIEGQETLNGTYVDADKVADWAKTYVNALVNLGYVNGRTADTLAPQENMTRAEMMVLLNKVIGAYVTESGVTVQVTGKGVALVLADDVKLEGAEFEGTVVVAAAAEVDTAGLTAAKVVATVPGVSVVNATLGTTVTAANGATGVTVNNTVVEADKSETVTDPVVTPDPVDPTPDEPKAPIIVHVHSYKNWTGNNDGTHTGTCECGETKTADCEYGEWAPCENGTQHERFCEVCGDGVGADCVMEGTDATCVTGGEKKCATCGRVVKTKATGHVNCDCDMEEELKFGLSVSSGGTTVSANVYSAYSAVVTIPEGTVDAGSVTVTATMQNVGSLGVDEKKEHSITVNTGIDKDGVSLKQHLGNAFSFGYDEEGEKTSTIVNVDIQGKTFAYEVEGENGVITATPDDVDAARAAWMELTSHVVADPAKETDDSYIVIANGSSVAVGGEILCFETENDLVLDNFNDLDELKQNIKDNVKVEDYTTGNNMIIVVKAGTELAISSSSAVLEDDCTIVLEGINASGEMNKILSKIRTAGNSNTTQMVKELVGLVNGVIGGLNNSIINVTVSFN